MYPNNYNSLLQGGLSFLKKINFSNLLDGTSKTLGVINQAIPVYYQVKPLVSNLKTVFKISNALKENTPQEEIKKDKTSSSSIFYV